MTPNLQGFFAGTASRARPRMDTGRELCVMETGAGGHTVPGVRRYKDTSA